MPENTCCARCCQLYPTPEPPNQYCGPCVSVFQTQLKDARKGQYKGGSHATPRSQIPASRCPATFNTPDAAGDPVKRCGLCGCVNLSEDYGHCPYGLGTYHVCEGCKAILDFRADKSGS